MKNNLPAFPCCITMEIVKRATITIKGAEFILNFFEARPKNGLLFEKNHLIKIQKLWCLIKNDTCNNWSDKYTIDNSKKLTWWVVEVYTNSCLLFACSRIECWDNIVRITHQRPPFYIIFATIITVTWIFCTQ